MPGLDGEHILAIEPIRDGRVRFVHDFYYRGQLVEKFAAKLNKDTIRDAEGMNQALKVRAEHRE